PASHLVSRGRGAVLPALSVSLARIEALFTQVPPAGNPSDLRCLFQHKRLLQLSEPLAKLLLPAHARLGTFDRLIPRCNFSAACIPPVADGVIDLGWASRDPCRRVLL